MAYGRRGRSRFRGRTRSRGRSKGRKHGFHKKKAWRALKTAMKHVKKC